MTHCRTGRLRCALVIFCLFFALPAGTFADTQRGKYRGTLKVVKHDISPPLKDIPPLPLPQYLQNWGGAIIDPPGISGKPDYGPQDADAAMQSVPPAQEIPNPSLVFDAINNVAGFAPPDPVGDIGVDHYVTMSNVHFVVHDRVGGLVAGPLANNTLWSGFGGQCETQNAGDPIVLYDQFTERWILTQFTSNAEPGTGDYFNCVAVSTTSDPSGSYHRYQINNGSFFPDYPKYGVGREAYFISTRDFAGGAVGVGVYALNKQDFINGTPGPNSVIAFFVDRSEPEIVGDGLLPMDIDGFNYPSVGSPHYYIGTMDDGGGYGAAQDAISVWEFVADFAAPASSSFELAAIVPIAAYDTVFPCGGGRECIPQPMTANRLDHQGYRQRPLHRAAYRNFGTHESIVTLQSVEADPGISGMRWWEIRNFGATPTIFQEGTFAPGNTDGIHRWFGSIAQDTSGNMALGYSAANETTYPSIWYSGRLSGDPAGTMPQGEGVIVDGTGSQTGGGNRWGDYSSMNVDPTDDCTFWYVNEYLPTTSLASWVLRVGAFQVEACEPDFTLYTSGPARASICTPDDASFDLNIGSLVGFDESVSLSASGHPAGSTATFDVNPVTPLPGTSTLTIGETGGATPGVYGIDITGMAAGADNRVTDAELTVWDDIPDTPNLTSPPDTAEDQPLTPSFMWSGPDAETYVIEVATDSAFTNIVWSETTGDTTATVTSPLASSSTYYWRVRGVNACGPSTDSGVFSFTTEALPGDCPAGESIQVAHVFDFESGAQGWTSGQNTGPNTWALSMDNPFAGLQHWHVDDHDSVSDQFLASPALEIPTGLSSLTFRFLDFQAFEAPPTEGQCWDGGMLEVSTDGGDNFVAVPGTDLLTNPYDGVLRNDASNPLGTREAWCDPAQPYTDTRVNIGALAGMDNVVFRFRVGTDIAVGAPGWDIDEVRVVGCSPAEFDFSNGFETPDP